MPGRGAGFIASHFSNFSIIHWVRWMNFRILLYAQTTFRIRRGMGERNEIQWENNLFPSISARFGKCWIKWKVLPPELWRTSFFEGASRIPEEFAVFGMGRLQNRWEWEKLNFLRLTYGETNCEFNKLNKIEWRNFVGSRRMTRESPEIYFNPENLSFSIFKNSFKNLF